MWQIPAMQEIHLWYASLAATAEQEKYYAEVLSPDEALRGERFHFKEHQRRFRVARGILRFLLAQYLQVDPRTMPLAYHARGKPYLPDHLYPVNLQFNVSHSQDMALYGVTQNHPIGVDIEKIQETYPDGVAKRFFSQAEYAALAQFPPATKLKKFYQLWAKKEALIKAVGTGLFMPLHTFSVSLTEEAETLSLPVSEARGLWHLQTIDIDAAFAAAFATQQSVQHIILRRFSSFSFY